jgi:triacylglycerol esterase/lipase EstA (alpha/beta hydrolase family)
VRAGLLALLAMVAASFAPVAARADNPVGLLYQSLGVSPPGANDFSCRPTAAHPDPVVLVHGTLFDQTLTWNLLAPALERAGYCVFALDYGNRGTQPIEQSAAQLATFIGRVLSATGAGRVSIVGHSQGGMMPRYYLKFMGGTAHVDKLIGLAPSIHPDCTGLALLNSGGEEPARALAGLTLRPRSR